MGGAHVTEAREVLTLAGEPGRGVSACLEELADGRVRVKWSEGQ